MKENRCKTRSGSAGDDDVEENVQIEPIGPVRAMHLEPSNRLRDLVNHEDDGPPGRDVPGKSSPPLLGRHREIYGDLYMWLSRQRTPVLRITDRPFRFGKT